MRVRCCGKPLPVACAHLGHSTETSEKISLKLHEQVMRSGSTVHVRTPNVAAEGLRTAGVHRSSDTQSIRVRCVEMSHASVAMTRSQWMRQPLHRSSAVNATADVVNVAGRPARHVHEKGPDAEPRRYPAWPNTQPARKRCSDAPRRESSDPPLPTRPPGGRVWACGDRSNRHRSDKWNRINPQRIPGALVGFAVVLPRHQR